MKFLSLALILVFFGCAKSPDADAPNAAPACATYHVPVTEADLVAHANFAVDKVFESTKDGAVTLKYRLPRELTGTPVDITFTSAATYGADQARHFSGDAGTMECLNDTCQVQFTGLKIDENEVTAYLHSAFPKEADFRAQQRVSREFSGDPGGVLNYRGCGL